ncbi:Isotrichodermin C-15 hydroxylase [Cladophialophora carrionii]|uniref:Isotrichodermin C-15 hydroxylase n=1 Tax=Cladophialophora carrionii TaxID=86049 RepID=A0A1C1CFC4_9EURO|nr:Isotrichodermin C-15 hydroxylase [Cladophialophora carrionii]
MDVSLLSALRVLAIGLGIWFPLHMIYNLYFHPLARFPGPFWARTTLFWRFWHDLTGLSHWTIQDCHRKYGDVFRVGPNELSFASVQAYKDIYAAKGPRPLKSEFYDMLGTGFSESCVVTERDHKRALQKRALFTSAMSSKALMEQEVVIQRCIDGFVEKLGKLGGGPGGLDLTKWYMMLSFDIGGEMAFGESFGCVDSETSNHWLDTIFAHLHAISIMDNIRRMPLVEKTARLIPTKWTTGIRNRITGFAREKSKRRVERSGETVDFLSNVVEKVRSGKISHEEMAAHCSIIAIASSETSATSLATITYFLLRSPAVHHRLKAEIRDHFKSPQEIDIASATKLPYLFAVIEEGLRIVPTTTVGFLRRVPFPGIDIDGHFVPGGAEVSVSGWTTARDERYFHDPLSFKPERWLDPECKDVKEASQPFSLGPRSCPGKTFAYAQMSVELAKMIWTYDMELVDPSLDWEKQVRLHFVLWKPELYVRFIERKLS